MEVKSCKADHYHCNVSLYDRQSLKLLMSGESTYQIKRHVHRTSLYEKSFFEKGIYLIMIK